MKKIRTKYLNPDWGKNPLKNNFRHILVPVDFSDVSTELLEYAAFMAGKLKARITILHVIENDEIEGIGQCDFNQHMVFVPKVKQILHMLTRNSLLFKRTKITELCMAGDVCEAINNIAEAESVDMIIMGKNGNTADVKGRNSYWGSKSYRIVNTSPLPVIILEKNKKESGSGQMLVPLDLSKQIDEKLTFAFKYAQITGSILHFLYVETESRLTVKGTDIRNRMNQIIAEFNNEGLECYGRVVFSNEQPGIAILKHSNNTNAGLILVMSGGENNPVPGRLGKTAKEITFNSHIPVMVIKPASNNNKFWL